MPRPRVPRWATGGGPRPAPAKVESSETDWVWLGDPNRSVLIAGHSHRGAYAAAINQGLATGAAVLVPAPFDSAAPPQPDRTYWRVACSAPGRVLAVVWNGNQHNRHFLFTVDERFRRHDGGEFGTVVSASTISAFWEPSLAGMDLSVTSVQAEHTVVLGTPPPKAEEEIRASLQREPVFLEAIGAAGGHPDTIPITPVELRVAIWQVLQGDLEARAARVGAVFVPVPASAQTADGCLRPEYSGSDASHANGAFGALMLGEIEGALAPAEVLES